MKADPKRGTESSAHPSGVSIFQPSGLCLLEFLAYNSEHLF